MPKLNSYNGEERFNFLISLIGYLQGRGTVSIEEVSEHFSLEPAYIRKAITSLNDARAFLNGHEECFFYIDPSEVDEGFISLSENLVIEEAPRLSTRQAAAIAAGLNYLQSLPEFAQDADIPVLQSLLAEGTGRGLSQIHEFKPGSAEAGAELIRKAILEGLQIQCEYFNQRGERSERVIHPLRLDPRPDGAYLRGYCPKNQDVRNFKLDRMRAISVLPEPISESAKSVGEIEDALYVAGLTDTEVVVEVQPEAYRLITEFQAVSEPTADQNGTIRATIKVGHLPNIGRLIAKYGGAAKVIAPEEARRLVREYALQALGQAESIGAPTGQEG
ncbi:MAG: hypothetical protein RLZZ258_485 [Actinomycetota bacterium]|jgi:proteasome accessory factor C